MPVSVNILTFGGSGYVPGNDTNVPGAAVVRGSNGETLQSAVVAGNTLPAGLAGGKGIVNGGASYQAYQTITAAGVTLNGQSPKTNYMDATSAAFIQILPPISTSDTQEFEFYKVDGAHNVTLQGAGTDNIQLGAASANTLVMSTQGQRIKLHAANGVWRAA